MAHPARWPALRPAHSSPSSHPDGDAQASADPSHRILVRHPHYAPSASLLLLLHAPDHPDGGIHHETLRVWCAAIADNRFDGCLSDTRDGPETDTPRDHVLRCGEYFFLVPGSSLEHPYPVVPAFSHWRFPTKLPSDWRALPIAGERLAPAHSSASDHILERDVSCRFSGSCEGVQAAHVVPRGELLWFKRNEMDTRILDVRRTDAQALDDVTNRFLLRADLHDVFDQGRLVVASKRRPAERGSSPSRPSLAIHVLAPSEELVRLYHNVDLKDLRGMAPEFLFARFVWSVFPQVQAFVSRGVRRRLRIYTEDGASETAWFSGDECSALSMPPPRPRSASSKRPRKRSISDFDLADQEPSHKRRATDSRRPCKQPLFSPPSDPSTPLTHIQRLRDDALKRERAASGVENLVEEDLKWRDEAIGRTLSHEEAIRLPLFHHPRIMVLRQQQPTRLLVLTGASDGGDGGDEDDNQNSKARFVDRGWMLLDTLAFQLDVAASVNADADDKLDEMLTNFMDEVRGSAQDACPGLLEIRLDEPVEV